MKREGKMEAEWEEDRERENKLGHVFKSTTARENLRREKVWVGKHSTGGGAGVGGGGCRGGAGAERGRGEKKGDSGVWRWRCSGQRDGSRKNTSTSAALSTVDGRKRRGGDGRRREG